MDLAITQSVNMKDPKELWRILNSQDEEEREQVATFDAAGFELFKQTLRSNPRMVIK
jgi:hypothetical protein